MNMYLRSFSICKELRKKYRIVLLAMMYVFKEIIRVKGYNISIKFHAGTQPVVISISYRSPSKKNRRIEHYEKLSRLRHNGPELIPLVAK